MMVNTATTSYNLSAKQKRFLQGMDNKGIVNPADLTDPSTNPQDVPFNPSPIPQLDRTTLESMALRPQQKLSPQEMALQQAAGMEWLHQREALAIQQGVTSTLAQQRMAMGQTPTSMINTPEQVQQSVNQQELINTANATQGLRSNIGNITAQDQAFADLNNPALGVNPTQGIVASALSKGAVGAAGGAVAGGLGGAGIGAIPGAIIGGIGGIALGGAGSVLGNLKEDYLQNTKVQRTKFKDSTTNIKAIIDGVNKGALDPIEGVNLYNRELAKIDRTERNLKLLSEKDWSKSKDELVLIQDFNDNQRVYSARLLEQAILKKGSDITWNYEVPTDNVQ